MIYVLFCIIFYVSLESRRGKQNTRAATIIITTGATVRCGLALYYCIICIILYCNDTAANVANEVTSAKRT